MLDERHGPKHGLGDALDVRSPPGSDSARGQIHERQVPLAHRRGDVSHGGGPVRAGPASAGRRHGGSHSGGAVHGLPSPSLFALERACTTLAFL